eukprot:1698_1
MSTKTLHFLIITCVLILQGNTASITYDTSVMTPEQIALYRFTTWQKLLYDLYRMSNTATTAHQLLNVTSNIAKAVSNQYPFHLTEYHQTPMSQFYTSIINQQTVNISQTQLVQVIRNIMEQNEQLGIGLTVSVWHSFFHKYYTKSHNEYRESYCFKLLKCMTLNGSEVQPDLMSFNLILFGIAKHANEFVLAERITDRLIEIMHEVKIDPDPLTYALMFRIFVQKENMHRATQLLLHSPSIRFADVDIVLYNKVIKHLPNFADGITNT